MLNLESLENRAKGIEVACVRMEGDVQVATVQVPEGALTHFFKLVEKYLTEDTKGTEKTPPKPKHQDTVNDFWASSTDDLEAASGSLRFGNSLVFAVCVSPPPFALFAHKANG